MVLKRVMFMSTVGVHNEYPFNKHKALIGGKWKCYGSGVKYIHKPLKVISALDPIIILIIRAHKRAMKIALNCMRS